MKILNILKIFCFIALFPAIISAARVRPDTLSYLKNPNYQRQINLYKTYKIKQADIVMLGNSIVHGVDWPEILGRRNIVEQGIPGDVVEGMLARVKYVYRLKPKVVVIMAGINDIYNWVPTNVIYQRYITLIEGMRIRGITPIITSTLYAGKEWGRAWIEENRPELNYIDVNKSRNKEVEALNKLLKSYCKKNNLIFIDLNAKTSTRDKFIKKELTWDNLHLNSRGYKIWAKELDKTLRKLGL